MRTVNIYALTRTLEPERIERMERQMSGRDRFLKFRSWEMESLKAFTETLSLHMGEAADLFFYYSFTMPKLGKEFDLLRVNDEFVLNIEIKSGEVAREAIQKQLLQNRYYLAFLGITTYSYTFISSSGTLLRLSNSGRLVDAEWEKLIDLLRHQTECYEGDIEELFKEDRYLISPLTNPGRFLRQEYFLTSQQRDIKKKILKQIRESSGQRINPMIHGFCGLPGTGKSILLYDLAMELSRNARVCVFHFGSHAKELEQLDARLKRVDFYYGEVRIEEFREKAYSAILVDEGHKMEAEELRKVLTLADRWQAPLIASYDEETMICAEERQNVSIAQLEAMEGFVGYRLTNRIRLNRELSSFIQTILHLERRHTRRDYSNVALLYASNAAESAKLLQTCVKRGYTYIYNLSVDAEGMDVRRKCGVAMDEALCKEFDRILMRIDPSFYYDAKGYLRSSEKNKVRNLFHGLSRAKKKITILVEGNPNVFDRMLGILQRHG